MTGRKNRNINDFQEDPEYGFPFVEVLPLVLNSESIKEEFSIDKIEESELSASIVEDEIVNLNEVTKQDVDVEPTALETPKIKSAENKPIEIKKTERTFQSTPVKKKSSGPLVMILTLLIVVVLGAMAYFLYYLPEGENGQQVANEEVKSSQNESALVNNELSAAGAEVMGEEVEKEVTTEVQEPEVAPTSAELILIRDREVKPYYYIVVSSMISESIARSEAEKLIGMDKNTWIIFPYEDVKNYRIAVGKLDNINTATEAWETAKGEFGDATWILKY
jgi:hypothetical protein